MKILQSCQKDFAFFGIIPPPAIQQNLINQRIAMVLFICIKDAILANVFFFYKAKNLAEYADSFSASWSVILIGINYSLIIYKRRDVYKFIETLECTINKSKMVMYNFLSFKS